MTDRAGRPLLIPAAEAVRRALATPPPYPCLARASLNPLPCGALMGAQLDLWIATSSTNGRQITLQLPPRFAALDLAQLLRETADALDAIATAAAPEPSPTDGPSPEPAKP